MTDIVALINEFGTQAIAAAVALGIIGVAVGTLCGILGYRHGSDVTRGSLIGCVLIILVRVIAATFASKVGVTGL